eukprot:TRINITY_DN921_c0_g1_i1.p1 TRINITY_DN921_c0_g1~~TRINITY_DN921_c0_g1_i1.p1  ORF type:complete len:196 (-),score=40.41 TRINITY_DN921_c0_g1_i1:1022-1609(-)
MSPDFGLLKTLIDELRDQMNEDFRAKDLPHPQDFIQPLSSGDLTVLVDMKVQEISNTPDCPSTVDQFLELDTKIQSSLKGRGGEIMTPEQLEEIQKCCDFVDELRKEPHIDGTVACEIVQNVSEIIHEWEEKVVEFCKELTNMTGKYEAEEKNYRASILEIENLKNNKRLRDMRKAQKEFSAFCSQDSWCCKGDS